MENVNFIVTAKHYGGSAREYIRRQQQAKFAAGIAVQIRDLDKEPVGTPVYARIYQGQWIADCECGGAMFVDPDEPIFFCFGCGNRAHGKIPRPVIFPPEEERKEIERLILERPVNDLAGLTDLERAGMARPVLFSRGKPLLREWKPGQSVQDLRDAQDEVIKAFRGVGEQVIRK